MEDIWVVGERNKEKKKNEMEEWMVECEKKKEEEL